MPAETSTIRKEISETREELGQNLNALEDHLKENWQDVKHQLNPLYHTRRHPWIAVGASVAVGAVATTAVTGAISRPTSASRTPSSSNRYFASSGVAKAALVVLDKFSDEIDLMKNMFIAAGVRKLGSLVKQNFPAASNSVDKVVNSALTKVQTGSEGILEGRVSTTSFSVGRERRSFYSDDGKD